MDRSSFPCHSLLLAAAAVAVAARSSWSDHLCYRRSAILAGQVWRLLTGHLVHASRDHLLWDVAALLLIGLLFERHLGKHFVWVTVVGMLAVGGGLLALDPALESYCGLSGLLSALWVCGAMLAAHAERVSGRAFLARLYWTCLALDGAKLCYEAFHGSPLFVEIHRLGGFPVPAAHLFGALAGLLSSMVVLSREPSDQPPSFGFPSR